jgi:DNA-binding PadR family transcriptional regulator
LETITDLIKFFNNKALFNETIEVDDILDLEIKDLFVLYIIKRFSQEIIRNTLREEIKSFLGIEISTSSFYNLLNKLEKKGLIIYNTNTKRISTTKKAEEVFFEVTKFTLLGQVNFVNLATDIIPLVLKKIQKKALNKVLLINFENILDIQLMNLIKQISSELFILVDDNDFKRLKTRGLREEIQQSKFQGGRFREPNEFFDSVIILGYDCVKNREISLIDTLIEDLKRIIIPGGNVFFVSNTEIESEEDHFLITNMKNLLENNFHLPYAEKEELLKEIELIGLKNIDSVMKSGVIVAWGVK